MKFCYQQSAARQGSGCFKPLIYAIDVAAIRQKTGLSQAAFALRIRFRSPRSGIGSRVGGPRKGRPGCCWTLIRGSLRKPWPINESGVLL
ncbi:hypothetical protein DC522_24710 [Microvirga sp. KLBC 81]|nr:hypothetical protein DC522_24710 [Microvirga sp. KLBC 81]